MCARLARALYDNVAECPEELSFRRGDLLVLLQPAAPGPAGWHLCALHGQPGIVPANRVRLLPEPGPLDPSSSPAGASLHEGHGRRNHEPPEDKEEEEEQGVYVVPPPARPCPLPLDAIYNVPRGARRDGDPGEQGTNRSQPLNMDQPTPKDLPGPGIEPETPPLPKEEEEVPRPGPEDVQLLQFYAGQCQGHYTALQAAMAALLTSAEAQEPPSAFVPHGKRVIVTAHKLVFVGDTLARLASSAPVRAHVGAAAGSLCQALREAVLAVKGAALSYPSASAARLLRQRVAELARRALAFTSLLGALAPS